MRNPSMWENPNLSQRTANGVQAQVVPSTASERSCGVTSHHTFFKTPLWKKVWCGFTPHFFQNGVLKKSVVWNHTTLLFKKPFWKKKCGVVVTPHFFL